MQRSLAVVCCLLVVLAGCSGGGPTTEASTTTDSSVSPTDTSTEPATSGTLSVDLSTLARVHARQLANRSYTLAVDRGGGPRVTSVDDSGLARIEEPFGPTVFRTATASFRNATDDGTNRYVARPATQNRSTGAALLSSRDGALVVTDTTTVDGETRYVLTPGIDYANASGSRPYVRVVAGESGLVYRRFKASASGVVRKSKISVMTRREASRTT